MKIVSIELFFSTPSQYIADPYWPEQFRVIEITKQSGMNRAKSDANRRKSLEEYLRMKNMTLDDFEKLKVLAKRPFHTNEQGEIIIPADRVLSFLVATCDEARAAYKPCPPEQVRSRFVASDFVTSKTKPDGIWSRFSTVTAGTGNKLSNQRGLRENPFIENFSASGTVTFDEQFINSQTLENAIKWGGEFVGIGASRKMGKGRFKLSKFTVY